MQRNAAQVTRAKLRTTPGAMVAKTRSHLPMPRPSADVLVLATVVFWSINVVVLKVALRTSGPFTISAIRFVVGGTILIVLVRTVEGRIAVPSRRDLRAMAIAGALGVAVNQAAFTVALRYTTAVDVSLIVGATPIVVAIVAVADTRDRIGMRAWAGLVVGLAGLGLVVGFGKGGDGAIAGDAVALVAPVAFAFYVSRLRRLMPRHSTLELGAWVTALGTLPLIPFAIGESLAGPPEISWQLIGLLAYSGILPAGFCTVAYYRGVQRLGATRATAYVFLQPFLGALIAYWILGDPLAPLQLLGGIVLVVGVVVGRPRSQAIDGASVTTSDGT
jgi:drug/metabolite transporter (DMT)-like permease